MKLNKMKWLGTILWLSTLFMLSCDKDEEIGTLIDQEQVHKKEITYKNFEQILLQRTQIDPVSKQLIETDSFILQSAKSKKSIVVKVKKGVITQLNSSDNLTTYSIHVEVADNDVRKHYYKLIYITQLGNSTYKLLKFIPENGVIPTHGEFKGIIENIALNETPTIVSKACVDTYFVYEVFMPCINHPGQYEPNASMNCDGGHWETRVGTIRCSSGGSSGGSTSGGGTGWSGGGSTGEPINYLGDYPVDEDPYPLPTPDEVFTNFKMGLSQEDYSFLLKNPTLELQIKEYLFANLDYQNNFTNEAKEFVKELINLAMVNTDYNNVGVPVSPNFKMKIEDQLKYPKFTNMVKNIKNDIENNTKIINSLIKYSGLSKEQILNKLTFGNGPLIKLIPDLTGNYGRENYGNFNHKYPNIININSNFALGMERAVLPETVEATAFLMAVTLLHEFVHYGNLLTGYDVNGQETGNLFENSVFGYNIVITKDNAGYYLTEFKK